jgi:hypothetical protein
MRLENIGAAMLAVSIWGLAAVGGNAGATAAQGSGHSHAVPLDCTADGGDMRTPADASVQPGVIVAQTFPFLGTFYTPFLGSLGGRTLSAPIAGMIPNGSGYTLIGQDGQLYPFT